MSLFSRRQFIQSAGTAGIFSSMIALPIRLGVETGSQNTEGSGDPLAGIWQFKLDPQDQGEKDGWQLPGTKGESWKAVRIPHTWQTDPSSASYQGNGWYRKTLEAPKTWINKAVHLEFEAVYHSTTVWLNGKMVGEHLRRGYTAFTVDLSPVLSFDHPNTLVVRVNNSFDPNMLPRGNSFDWTMDGGIYRPLNLLVTPKVYVERVAVDADPDVNWEKASLEVKIVARNTSTVPVDVQASYRVVDEENGAVVFRYQPSSNYRLLPEIPLDIALPPGILSHIKLWHFDHPHLYRLEAELHQGNEILHSLETMFGVRKIEVRRGGFYLNGERVWLMGVERMAGSHPDYGMAEPESWIIHDHDDMKALNCVFTRAHWPQDRRVLDYCDRHGILIQAEVPTWGPDTFKGMGDEPDPMIMRNGLEQLREMIERDRNHPSIFAWGLCNEINGQNPPAYRFAVRMYQEAKRLDPRRLRSYASNTLQDHPDKDVAGLMDFVEWNEYYESWYGGSAESVRNNLESIHQAFPEKVVVISEYGYCECTPERAPGDQHRIRIMRSHNDVFREFDFVGGAIFFCYNDYRTHIGDKGVGVLKQRVHGVVDLYGDRKPSFEALRLESSPIQALELEMNGNQVKARILTRKQLPAYRLEGYRLHWIVFGYENLPMEQNGMDCPVLLPGTEMTFDLPFKERDLHSIRVDLVRPTGFSAATAHWKHP